MFLDKDLPQDKWKPGDGIAAPGPGSTVSGGDSFHSSPAPIKTDVTQIGPARIRSRADINVEQAVQNFIDLWCKQCPILDMLKGTPIEEIKTLCPQSTINTCPTYNKIKLYQSVTAGHQPAAVPEPTAADLQSHIDAVRATPSGTPIPEPSWTRPHQSPPTPAPRKESPNES